MTPSLSEPFCFPESSETPYSVVTNGSVIHPLSLNYRFPVFCFFFGPHFAQAYGSICTPYNSTPQFTSGIYYNGLHGVSSLTPAALSKETRGGNKRAMQSGTPSVPSNLACLFFFSICNLALHATLAPRPHITIFPALCVFSPLL